MVAIDRDCLCPVLTHHPPRFSQCNFAAVLTLHAFAMYTMEAYWLAFTVGLVATILLFIGADMAIRSLRLKLMARANSR